MKQRSFGHSDPGRTRKDNEDAILMAVENGLYVLCDGCGGHAAGKISSQMTCNMTYEAIKAGRTELVSYAAAPTPDQREKVIGAISSGVNAASERVWAAAQNDPEKEGMATTVVVLTVMGNQAIIAHAGDSRAYLLRGGKIHQITEDHTMASRYVKMGLLSPEGAKKAPSAARLLRAVGFHQHVKLETLHFELAGGDRLVMCSDGLTGYLSEEEIAKICLAGPSMQVPHKLIQAANQRGGEDNISVIMVEVDASDPADAEAAADLARRLKALQAVPLFRKLTFVELLRVMGIARTASHEAGEMIVTEGEPSEWLYVNLTGKVKVLKKGHALVSLPVGSLFGEMGFLDANPRSADVQAEENVRLLAIPRDGLLDLLRSDRTLAVRVLWGLCRVLNHRLQNTSESLSFAKDYLAQLDDPNCPLTDSPTEGPVG